MLRKIFFLKHIQDISLIKIDKPLPEGGVLFRIESYDIAHMGGGNTVGVMVVLENGVANKNNYRKFRIRQKTGGDDLAALKEIITRRLGHPEWGGADLVVIDGGPTQLRAQSPFSLKIPKLFLWLRMQIINQIIFLVIQILSISIRRKFFFLILNPIDLLFRIIERGDQIS